MFHDTRWDTVFEWGDDNVLFVLDRDGFMFVGLYIGITFLAVVRPLSPPSSFPISHEMDECPKLSREGDGPLRCLMFDIVLEPNALKESSSLFSPSGAQCICFDPLGARATEIKYGVMQEWKEIAVVLVYSSPRLLSSIQRSNCPL